ncbi:MAG: aminotransferase class I/II-fold pyridoxal phosphate-dependent enzyme [Candidatus Gastranaerophilales bacterium]|nr:aminotransferase class I/II-fold pyridoxal phosphate-dependent enzyme [Candidatus Gastranaerophilales bacterium]
MKEKFNDYVQSLETYIMFRIKQETQRLAPELTAKGRKPISLSMGAPVEPPPEFVNNKLVEAMQGEGMHTYTSPKGEAYLLDSIAKRMKSRFNVDLDTKTEICSLIGSKEGIANMIRALINPIKEMKDRDIILIPDPGYASYKEMVKVSGGMSYPLPLMPENNYMPDLEETAKKLEKDGFSMKKVKALIINYPNNPLGAVTNKEYLKKAVDFCKKYNILLISDAAYIDMTFEGEEKAPSVFEIEGAKDVAVEFFSFSKPYSMTGWRIGWVCGNKEAVGVFSKLKSTIDTGIYKPIQKAAAAVLNSKEGDEYIVEANRRFERKQKIIVQGFKELGWNMDKINPPKATFYLWLPIPPKYKTSKEFTDAVLNKSGVVLVPGNAFGTNGEGWFRMSIVAAEEQMHEVIRRLKEDGFYFE